MIGCDNLICPYCTACDHLVPWPEIKAAPTTLEGRVLTTGLPGKFPNLLSFLGSSLTFIDDSLLSNLGFPGRFPDEFLSPSLPRQSLGLFSQSKAIYLLGLNCKNFHFYFVLCSIYLPQQPIALTIVNTYTMHMEMFRSSWAFESRAWEREIKGWEHSKKECKPSAC